MYSCQKGRSSESGAGERVWMSVDENGKHDSVNTESVLESRVTRALVAWVDGVRIRARGVLFAMALFTTLCIAFTATHIGINTSHTALLSDDLPFWQEYMAYAEVFPILDEALLVVVDADSPLAALPIFIQTSSTRSVRGRLRIALRHGVTAALQRTPEAAAKGLSQNPVRRVGSRRRFQLWVTSGTGKRVWMRCG